ncbi:crotonobetainyl-CoA hydratase [Bradyrhizobium diazoefficiens]|uniref:enoyl-CoA hydratase-related protein n=1 Tax=Bradyrhizobium diazoefficiens TaxID=1355477 RepID=UPI001909A686|nr:enoyl-CoA hydratase-related protein [Bradyrhizobium diazoefficiens]QQO35563.1 crotonobetainyl-CoA hydratase [Bradyrhizobium diazoefficiens]
MTSVRTQRNGPVLEIVLDRPRANAIDATTSRALGAVFIELRDDPSLRVGIVTGAGERFFSAGWDLKSGAVESPDRDWGPGGFAGLTELFDVGKPVIAAVNGLAAGGGFELVLACDLVVAAEHAEFFLPEARLGVIADSGGVFHLPRRLPHVIAMEMLFTGRRMSASEALTRGLVNAVTSAAEVLPRARQLAESVCASAPLAIGAYKEILLQTENLPLPEAYRVMRSDACAVYQRLRGSEDAKEGPRAFAEKRAARWHGC